MEDLFKEHFGTLLATLITGFGGWFFGRRKSNAEASIVEADYESKEIDNGGKIVSMYKEAIDDLLGWLSSFGCCDAFGVGVCSCQVG